jgi:hypothetical protein
MTKGPCKGDIDACRYFPVLVNGDGRITVVWRGRVTGAPIELRLLDHAADSLPIPEDVALEPGRRAVTFASSGRFHDCGEGLHLLWRSPSGRQATVEKTTTVVRYERNPPPSRTRGCL